MDEKTRRECTPQEYIRKLFEETKDGTLSIDFFPILDQPYALKYKMDWTEADAENMVKRYNALTGALTRIGELHDELQDESNREKLLTAEEYEVWNTYIRPFEPFEVDSDAISDLYFRRDFDTLEDEENDILERHYEWFVENSKKRLPFDKNCPASMINRAQRYVELIRMKAPGIVVEEEGRVLAKDMVLYYHCEKELVFDSIKFIMAQNRTYEVALKEIKNGKKQTHWMWFIFPQLRGLGSSNTANTYGIADLDEAKAYLAHEKLGANLIEISTELLKLEENDPEVIFGEIDAMKLRSSMTLFAYISEDNSVFHKVLEKFFDGQTDSRTLELLTSRSFIDKLKIME